MIGRFDDARPRRVGVRHVDGEKLRGRAYAEERHLFIFLSFVRCCYVCLCAFYVDGIFGAFRMRPRRRRESFGVKKRSENVSKTTMMIN